MYEEVLSTWPKKGDMWSQLLELEMGALGDGADVGVVRDIFERRTKVKGLKPKQAEKWFRRWAKWEEGIDPKGKERVLAKTQDWIASHKARVEAQAAAEAEDDEME